MMQTLLPEMVRGSIRPLKEALKKAETAHETPGAREMMGGCVLLAIACEQLQQTGYELLNEGTESEAAALVFKESLLAVEEALDGCLAIRDRLKEDSQPGRNGGDHLKTVDKAVTRVQKVRQFYADLLA